MRDQVYGASPITSHRRTREEIAGIEHLVLGIAAHVERMIRGCLPDGFPFTVERLAVTPAQSAAWQLPTRPKQQTDSQANGFAGESVELDAFLPAKLRALEQTRTVEALERTALYALQEQWGGAA